MYRLLLSRLDCLPCFPLNCLDNSCSSLNSYTTALSRALPSEHTVLSLPAVSICFIYTLYSVFQEQERSRCVDCQPSGKGCSVQNVLPLRSQRWGLPWARKGLSGSLTSKVSKTTHGRACQFSEGSKSSCDLLGSLLAQEKTIAIMLRGRPGANKRKGGSLAFSPEELISLWRY